MTGPALSTSSMLSAPAEPWHSLACKSASARAICGRKACARLNTAKHTAALFFMFDKTLLLTAIKRERIYLFFVWASTRLFGSPPWPCCGHESIPSLPHRSHELVSGRTEGSLCAHCLGFFNCSTCDQFFFFSPFTFSNQLVFTGFVPQLFNLLCEAKGSSTKKDTWTFWDLEDFRWLLWFLRFLQVEWTVWNQNRNCPVKSHAKG